MKKEEKEVLKKAVDSIEGLLSPSTIINSYAGQKRGLVEKLVSLGCLEMIPEEIRTGSTINFYRVTEKGYSIFYPIYKKLWFWFRGDVKTIIIAVITAIITTILTSIITG